MSPTFTFALLYPSQVDNPPKSQKTDAFIITELLTEGPVSTSWSAAGLEDAIPLPARLLQ